MGNLIDLHLDDLPDPTTVAPGEEYELKIIGAALAPSKSSERTVLKATLAIQGEAAAKIVFVNHAFPLTTDSNDVAYMMKRNIKDFCLCFGLDPKSPGEPAEWVGLSGFAILDEDIDQNENPINTVKRYIIKA